MREWRVVPRPPARRDAADDAVPDAGRLLSRQSRAQPAQARDQPDGDARDRRGARILARRRTAIAGRSSTATPPGSASGRKSRNIDPATGKADAALLLVRRAGDATFSGVLQGDFGCSTKFKVKVAHKLWPALEATGILMFWVMVVMIPVALARRGRVGHARGVADRPGAVDPLDRHDLDAGICVGRRAHHHLRDLARLAQRLGRRRRPRAISASTISPCRS